MHWNIDYSSGIPVYLQLVQQVRAAVASGALKDQDQLPSVRVLAEELRINRNTISKAYAELESESLIENRQGSGCFVTAKVTPLRHAVRLKQLTGAVDGLIVQARQLQIDDERLQSLLVERLAHFHAHRRTSNDE